MFCPKCATDNLDGARFCRSCGTNIAFIAQAISGQLAVQADEEVDTQGNACDIRKSKGEKRPRLEDGIIKIFTGAGFLFVAIAIALFGQEIAGQIWWFWLLIPAFASIGKGVADVVASRRSKLNSFADQTFVSSAPRTPALSLGDTGKIMAAAPSVTEGTTRHLGAEGPARSFVIERQSRQ